MVEPEEQGGIPDGTWVRQRCPRLQKHYGGRWSADCYVCEGAPEVWVLRDRVTRRIVGTAPVLPGQGPPVEPTR